MMVDRRKDVCWLILALVVACQTESPEARRDIVVFLTDDQRADMFIDYMPRTKALLADSGIVFSHAFANTPNCCPSRATFLTGLYQHNHGVLNNVPPDGGAMMLRRRGTIALWLQRAGYVTAYVGGKWANEYATVRPWPHVPPGWDEWHVPNRSGYYKYDLVERVWPNRAVTETSYGDRPEDYATDVTRRNAVEFVKRIPRDRALFLVVATSAPHRPAVPAPRDAGACREIQRPRPPSYDEADVTDKPEFVRQSLSASVHRRLAMDTLWWDMCATLQAVDRMVDAVVSALRETGRLDRTLLIYASDNGISFGEHRLWGRKGTMYEPDIRIPLAVRVPGVAPRIDSTFVQMADLAPTLLEWAGMRPPVPIDGLSLVPVIARGATLERDAILIENLWTRQTINPAVRAIRTRRYLYAEYESGERELYDMVLDPDQLESQHANPALAAVREQLAARLDSLGALRPSR